MYLGIALLCLTIVPSAFSDDDILKYMSNEEIRQVFNTDYDSVPKYEIVKLHVSERLHKRDLLAGTKMHLKAFGENINLWLHPAEPILAGENTPVYYARYYPGNPENVKYSRRDGLMRMVGRIFEDPYWLASFVIGTEESGSAKVNGYISSKRLAVRSLPPRIAEEYRRRRRSVGDFDDVDSTYHVVLQTTENYEKDSSVLPINATALRQRISRSTSGIIPDTLYPEVLVVLEYSLYRAYGRDIYGLLEYILAFWNGIDLKYRSLESPKIRFHISGIVLSEDPEATPYISNNSFSSDAFNIFRAMPDATKFYYAVKDTFPLDSYDIPLTMTRQKFGVDDAQYILGQAWKGVACEKNDTSKTLKSVSIIRDKGAFSGVHVAAHELGHLFGADHDFRTTNDDCLYSNGFLMSYIPRFTKNSSDFSTCSLDAIDTALKESQLDCLFNRPANPGKSLPKLMPGRIKNLDEQCKTLRRKAPCDDPNGTPDICVKIFCEDENGECKETNTAAVDGTKCGENKFCLHMKCVSL